ncbi:MAG: hypothetical protein KAG72_05885 [Abyssibacter sp.]|nr:hypothetical protein [Abyssibacter sp.]MCK5858858.1 hypothetical protein [Abyssibacter sp.]
MDSLARNKVDADADVDPDLIIPTPVWPPGAEALSLDEPEPHALGGEHFKLVSENGFGDGYNNYPHSMAWFKGRLYVGTTRATFQMLAHNDPLPPLDPWPVTPPKDIYDLDRRAEIWSYDPASDEGWICAYRAPWVKGDDGSDVPRFIGYRGMAVFQGTSDDEPVLYIATWAPRKAPRPTVMRTEDGIHFEELPGPNWGDQVRSFRTMQVFNGRLYTSPTGSTTGDRQSQECVGGRPAIFETADPRTGWRAVSSQGFGDPANLTVFEMAAFNNHLYAGTVNARNGFEIWKTSARGDPPYDWKRVISHGAGRGPLNEVAVSLCEFKGALYVGSGIVNGGYHRKLNVGPAAAEVIRIHPDDSWELIVGESRITPQGARYPLSGFRPGFNKFFNGYVWRMGVHAGRLYVGTFSWAQLLPYCPIHKWGEEGQRRIAKMGVDWFVNNMGGCDVWSTADGIHWDCMTRNGFDNECNWGIRQILSTPYGVFIATSNVLAPDRAIKRNGKWEYVHNPRGGCEIWRGANPPGSEHA